MPLPQQLHLQLLTQPVGGQVLDDVGRLILAAGGGELDWPHLTGNLESCLVRSSAPRPGPHQRRAHRESDVLRLCPDRIRDALDVGDDRCWGIGGGSDIRRPGSIGAIIACGEGSMANEHTPIDLTKHQDLDQIVEEVCRTGRPRVLRRGDEDVAVISPIRRRVPRSTRKSKPRRPDDVAAFRSAAGAWKDFDLEKFLRENEASRSLSRPPVEL